MKGKVIITKVEDYPKKKWNVKVGDHPVEFEFVNVECTDVMSAMATWVMMQACLDNF